MKILNAVIHYYLQENEKLKKKLAQYEQLEVTQIKKKVIKPSIFLCMVLLVVGVNFDIIR